MFDTLLQEYLSDTVERIDDPWWLLQWFSSDVVKVMDWNKRSLNILSEKE